MLRPRILALVGLPSVKIEWAQNKAFSLNLTVMAHLSGLGILATVDGMLCPKGVLFGVAHCFGSSKQSSDPNGKGHVRLTQILLRC